MKAIAGAIIVLGASICFGAGVVGAAIAKDKGEQYLGVGATAALILGIIGLVIVFAGMLDKQR